MSNTQQERGEKFMLVKIVVMQIQIWICLVPGPASILSSLNLKAWKITESDERDMALQGQKELW